MTQPYYVHGTNLPNRNKYTSVINVADTNKRYFSNIECEFYFGSHRFYDMVEFMFQIEEIPKKIYGYNSFAPTLIVPGRKEINGEFRINFLEGGGFISFLKSVEGSVMGNKMYNTITYCPDAYPTWGGANKSFDILIGYGYYKSKNKTYNATCQSLLGVTITGMRQELDTTGQPITEVYSFTAKNYVEKDFESLEENDTSSYNNSSKEEKTEEGPDYKFAEKSDKEGVETLEEICKNHENTIGIICDVRHNLNSQKTSGNITVELNIHNRSGLEITDVKLDILDQRVTSSSVLKLSSISNQDTKLKFKANVSSDINKSLKNILSKGSQKKVQAKLQFKCNEISKESPKKNTVYIYPGDNY